MGTLDRGGSRAAALAALVLPVALGLRPEMAHADEEPPAKDVKPAESSESTEESEELGITRGLSWDLLAGGIPSEGALIEASLGFSGLPRVAYHRTMSPELSLGGMVSFDYAYWAPSFAFASSLLFQMPVRYRLSGLGDLNLGLRADPGIGFMFAGDKRGPFALGLLLNGSASLGFTVQNRFIVGGGIDVPMALLIPTGSGGKVDLAIPILFGPILEFHVTPPLAITFDVKVGPHINTAGSTVFGFKMMAGIGYRL